MSKNYSERFPFILIYVPPDGLMFSSRPDQYTWEEAQAKRKQSLNKDHHVRVWIALADDYAIDEVDKWVN